MKTDRASSPGSQRFPAGKRFHARIITLAVLGWIGLSVAAVAYSFKDNRTSKRISASSIAESSTFTLPPATHPEFRTQSCSSSNCHGAIDEHPEPNQIRGDEYFVWLNDPHAQAFRTLSGQRSKQILQNLGVVDDAFQPLAGSEELFQKHWQNCLGCHETSRHLEAPAAQDRHVSAREGVSCESCHGKAENWLDLHYRNDWQKASVDFKSKLGLLGTHDKAARIRQCSTCHVGSSRGDVNHDLIAAGHPALRFEYVWYQSRLPKHWKAGRKNLAPDSPAQDWLLGQLVSAVASLELQERRISGQGFENIWPELADYNCFACHQSLRYSSFARQQRLRGPAAQKHALRYPIPWGNWNLSLVPLLAEHAESPEAREAVAFLQKLNETVQKYPPVPRAELVGSIQAARNSLLKWTDVLNRTPDAAIEQLVHKVKAQRPESLLTNWDQTANILLGIAASHRSGTPPPEALKKAMDHIRFVEVPKPIDSPQQFVNDEEGSGLSAAEWLELFRALSEQH